VYFLCNLVPQNAFIVCDRRTHFQVPKRLRTRPARTAFTWVKGHEENYGNNRADELANTGRITDSQTRMDEDIWIENHPALQDGARLQALGIKQIYNALVGRLSKKNNPMKIQEILNEAKDKVEENSGLRPTNEILLKGFKTMKIPPRVKDLMRYLIIGKMKCGTYWTNIPGYEGRALCAFCKKKNDEEIVESEQHMWLDCENNGQNQAWETTKKIWQKCTPRPWPPLSMCLIRGSPALSFENDLNKDAERLRTLISITIWSIWKSRNKCTILDQDVTPNETRETLKEQIKDLIRKRWNATRLMEEGERKTQQREIRKVWADKKFADFGPKSGPTFDLS